VELDHWECGSSGNADHPTGLAGATKSVDSKRAFEPIEPWQLKHANRSNPVGEVGTGDFGGIA